MNNQFQTAIGHYEKALGIAKKHEYKQLKAEALLELGDSYRLKNQFQTGIGHYEKGLEFARRTKYSEAGKKSLLRLGQDHKLKNRFQNTIQCIEESLQIGEGPEDRNDGRMAENAMKSFSKIIGRGLVSLSAAFKMSLITPSLRLNLE